jgi:hypothetical protein
VLQALGSVLFSSSVWASPQLSALTASMHWLAALLSKVLPAGHAVWAQFREFWSCVSHAEASVVAPQECALLHTAEANELQAEAGLLVSGPLHATRAAPRTSEQANGRSTLETSSLEMSEGGLSSSRATRKCREPRAGYGPDLLPHTQWCDERATAGLLGSDVEPGELW